MITLMLAWFTVAVPASLIVARCISISTYIGDRLP